MENILQNCRCYPLTVFHTKGSCKQLHKFGTKIMVAQISGESRLDQLMEVSKNGLVVIDFYATWCGPCKEVEPVFAKFPKSYPSVTFAKIDVDEFPVCA
ncbi:Thioredoxin [Fasciola gigantica]|uniref:Thioredoxin n=1 Tax=Fasciola gigantica TaxID=46835 RepID=A0A504YXA0_FASGI|nr:Thioredoxin [Fasciola gigantica]